MRPRISTVAGLRYARRHHQHEGKDSHRAGDRGADDERVACKPGRRAEGRSDAHARAEHHDRNAEAGARRNAQSERICERVPEERLHLQPGDAEGGAGQERRERSRQANGLDHDRRAVARRRRPRRTSITLATGTWVEPSTSDIRKAAIRRRRQTGEGDGLALAMADAAHSAGTSRQRLES